MQKKSNYLYDVRMRHNMTQQLIADALGVARNYVYLMEAGRKPITEAVRQKLVELDSKPPISNREPAAITRETQPSNQTCRYPQGFDIEKDFGSVREEMAVMRKSLSDMNTKLDTVTRLLGAALGKALGSVDSDHSEGEYQKRNAV